LLAKLPGSRAEAPVRRVAHVRDRLVEMQADLPDHARPRDLFRRNLCAKLLRRAAHGLEASPGEHASNVRHVQDRDDLLVEARHDGFGRLRGRDDAVPLH